MMSRLTASNLTALAETGKATLPTYDRSALVPGIVHLGLGAFHRAHQAVYTDAVLRMGDLRWGIIGVSLRQPDTRDVLAPQDNLYTVSVRDADGERLQVIGALIGSLVAPENPRAVLDAMADPRCHIVSLTVTEKGYCHDPATRTLRFDHPDIAHDLIAPDAPRSAIAFIVRALALRRANGHAPFTVLSCDNLPSNGDTTRTLVLAFAAAIDVDLADWIERLCAFPNSMVDRIVPKTVEEDRTRIAQRLGQEDASPVVTEPYCEWVIEERFAGPRPQWQDVGATLVARTEPYENAKLRMLNGSHSTLAYLGVLVGYETVDQAIGDPHLANFVERMMRDEIEPTLARPGLPEYRAELLTRFRNPSLKHKLQQIAMDGSQKLPQRLLGTIRERLAHGASCERLCFALAGWMQYLAGRDEAGCSYAISDPLAQQLRCATTISDDPLARVQAMLAIEAVFGTDGLANARLVGALTRHLDAITKLGVIGALATLQTVPGN